MKRMILGWLAAGILVVPMSAQALLVTVDGQAYDVKTITGTFDALQADLKTQPFWGNGTLAADLALAVNDDLGLPNSSGLAGPFFAYDDAGGAIPIRIWRWASVGGGVFEPRAGIINEDSTQTWATASPVPLPPALYLLGLGLAGLLGLGKRRRTQATPI